MKKGIYYTFKFKSFLLFLSLITLTALCVFSLNLYSVSVVNNTALTEDSKKTIIIDAGHGGEDGGTQSLGGVLEKDINLAISLRIKEILDSLGVPNILVRDGDYMIYDDPNDSMRHRKVSDIHNRLKLAENTDNSILLSIHQNYFEQSRYSGAQVFYSKNNPLSKEIAENIQKTIVKNTQPDNTRVIKQSGKEIYLLYHSKSPAVMVECGFLSNEEEAKKLCDETYQTKIALSICEGVLKFI